MNVSNHKLCGVICAWRLCLEAVPGSCAWRLSRGEAEPRLCAPALSGGMNCASRLCLGAGRKDAGISRKEAEPSLPDLSGVFDASASDSRDPGDTAHCVGGCGIEAVKGRNLKATVWSSINSAIYLKPFHWWTTRSALQWSVHSACAYSASECGLENDA